MKTMVELENPFSWFTDDPLILLITTIGLLIMTGLAVFESLKLIHDYRIRPRIEMKAVKEYEKLENEIKILFYIYIHNIGTGQLSNCKVRIRITDHSGNIDLIDKTGKQYQEEFLPWNWEITENSFSNELDLYPAKTEHGKFKLPLDVTIPNDESEYEFVNQGFGVKFNDPLKMSWKNPAKYLHGIGKLLSFYTVFSVYVNAKEKSFEKKFRVLIPINAVNFQEKFVLFEEKNLKTIFADGLFSFISFFRRSHDED